MSTPKIILICQGGVIQHAVSNIEVKIYNLDEDILKEGNADPDDTYDNRDIGNTLRVLSERAFNKEEAILKRDWNKELKKALNHT